MKKILLACTAGMSTSILVKKMKDAAFEEDIDVEIKAFSVGEAKTMADEWDILLLGPQVSYELDDVKAEVRIPVFVINKDDYAKGNGEAVLQFALDNVK